MLQVLAFVAFIVILLIVLGPIHWYLWKRMVKDTTRPGLWRRIGTGVLIALALSLAGAVVVPRVAGAKEILPVTLVGYLWLAVLFYLLLIMVVLEVPRAVIRLLTRPAKPAAPAEAVAAPVPAEVKIAQSAGQSGDSAPANTPSAGHIAPDAEPVPDAAGESRRLVLARGMAIFAGITAAGITGYGVRTALGDPVVKRVQIPLAKLPRSMDGYRIALVSDIHLGPLTGIGHTRRIVRMINEMDADLVAVVGDLVDGTVAELGDQAAPLRDLRSKDGAFYVTGNHEYYSGVEEWLAEVDRLGMRALKNERLEIRGIDLAGVNDVTGSAFGDGMGPDFAKTLGDRDPAKAVVLLAHQPVQAAEAAKYGVDLQLSGHTHGGQMAPFNLVAQLQQPVVSGLGEVDGTQVYVTNGAGFWGPPVRVGAPPDVTLLELRTK